LSCRHHYLLEKTFEEIRQSFGEVAHSNDCRNKPDYNARKMPVESDSESTVITLDCADDGMKNLEECV
jgi:hypothetical protein